MNARTLSLGALLAVSATSLGCSNDYSIDFRFTSEAPASVIVSETLIEIPAGMAVGVEAFPIEDDERRSYSVELLAVRGNIIGVDKALEEGKFVIYGIEPGTTEVEMYFDDEYVGDLPARVVEPDND